MAEKSIEEKVKDIIVEQLGVNPEQARTRWISSNW
jgi:acyl carrier protein